MIASTVNFSKLHNDNRDSNKDAAVTKNGKAYSNGNPPAGGNKYSDFSLYVNDTKTREWFPEYVGTENPAYSFLGDTEALGEEQQLHVYQYINKFKTMDLSFWGLGGSQVAKSAGGIMRPSKNLPVGGDKSWGTWRDPTINPAKIAVDPRILLFPKDFNFKFSYEHELGNAWEKLSDTIGLKKLSDAMEFVRVLDQDSLNKGGKFVSRFQKIPLWKGCGPIKFDGNLTFEFNFGSYGLFSGEHEVVRPILALASMWAPLTTEGNYAKGIAPTAPTYLAALAQQAAGTSGTDGNILDQIKKSMGATGLVNAATATSTEQTLFNVVNKALLAAAKPNIKTVYFRIGRMIFGPLIVHGVSFDFDFGMTDEYGFPSKGSLTLNNPEQIFMATPDMFVGMFDAVGGKGGAKDLTGDTGINYNVD